MKVPPAHPFLRLAPERFYWGVLDGTLVPRRGPGRLERLGYLFEGLLPGIPIEEVHAVYQRLPGTPPRYLACGMPAASLAELDQSGAVSLAPAEIPSFIHADVDPSALNLLSGRYRTRPVRRLERLWLVSVALLLAATSGLLVLRLERLAAAHHSHLQQVSLRRQAILQNVLGSSAQQGKLPAEQLLITEHRRLEQTRDTGGDLARLEDSSLLLGELLARWPADLPLQTESLSVGPSSIVVHAQAPTMADAQRLADALGALPGWRLEPPRSLRRGDATDVTLTLEPATEEER